MISCGITKHLVYCLISIILSAFINGINISVRESAFDSIYKFTNRVIRMRLLEEMQRANPGKDLEKDYQLIDDQTNEKLKKFLVMWTSTYLIAAISGALFSGYSGNRYGRKKSLLWNNSLIFVALFFLCFSARFGSYEMIIIGQFFIGFNVGMTTSLAPIYLTEVSPIRMRGIFGSAYIVSTSLAIFTTHILISSFEFENWIYMFSSVVIPSILMIVALNECPESPRYSYFIRGDQIKAQNELQRLRENSEINEELYEMKVEYQAIERNVRFSYHSLWADSKIRNALFISIIVVMSKHMTGINAIQYFTKSIYQKAGLSSKTESYISNGILFVGFKTSLIFALFVEKLGRRTLLLVGLLGMFCAQIFITFCLIFSDSLEVSNYLNLITLILYIILYSCGPTFIPHFYFVELFRTDSRSVGAGLSVATLYAIPLIFSFSFSALKVL